MEHAERVRVDKPRAIPNGEAFGGNVRERAYTNNGLKYPKSILRFSNANQKGKQHPTQKPVDLFRYLIRTYTNPGDLVLDNCMGSGTTAIAATLEGRSWIGFETEPKYVEIANKRLDSLEIPAN